jgi:hypothetical protein
MVHNCIHLMLNLHPTGITVETLTIKKGLSRLWNLVSWAQKGILIVVEAPQEREADIS